MNKSITALSIWFIHTLQIYILEGACLTKYTTCNQINWSSGPRHEYRYLSQFRPKSDKAEYSVAREVEPATLNKVYRAVLFGV